MKAQYNFIYDINHSLTLIPPYYRKKSKIFAQETFSLPIAHQTNQSFRIARIHIEKLVQWEHLESTRSQYDILLFLQITILDINGARLFEIEATVGGFFISMDFK